MAKINIEEIYDQYIKPLPMMERLRLIEMTVHDLAARPSGELPERHDWMSIRGIAPDLLGREDAQTWVSRTRHEADEGREQRWKHEQ